MIILISKNTLQNGKEADFLKIAQSLAEASQKEEGCLFYRLAKDEKEEDIYYFIEVYADEAALAAHRASRHFQEYVPMLAQTRTKPSELTKCETVDF